MRQKICSRCGGPNERLPQRYCHECHAAYQRANRPAYSEFTPEQKAKARCHATAKTAKMRGKLIPKPCERCKSTEDLHMHHDDYDKPLDVRWFCAPCHRSWHKGLHETYARPT